MQFDPQKLSRRLSEVRKQRELTQAQLADLAQLSYFTVAKLEQGKINDPSFFTILALCDALKLTPDQFIGSTAETTEGASETLSEEVSGVYVGLHGVLLDNFDEIFGSMAAELGVEPGKVEDRFWRYEEALATARMSVFDFEQALAFDLGVKQRQIKFRERYLECCTLNKAEYDKLFSYKNSGKKVGLLTNSFPGFIDALITNGTLPCSRDDFDMVVDSSEVGIAKPFAGIYEAAELAANLPPRKLMLIDDIPSNVEAAKARNWHGAVYRS